MQKKFKKHLLQTIRPILPKLAQKFSAGVFQ